MDQSTPILVTGASGFIASWIVKYLLEDGFTVHGTVRSLEKARKVKHLQEMQAEYGDRIKLFEADLLKEGSFLQAMQGCGVVMHTASPFLIGKIKDGQKQLVDPALKGTENVLNSVNETESVKRIVLTSSVVAIMGDASEAQGYPNKLVTEDHWNQTSSVDHQPYAYSKTVAEKRAWEMEEAQSHWDMVTIHPSFVLGPSLSGRLDSASQGFIKQMIGGGFKMGVPGLTFGVVDVREIARAHIQAAINEKAAGRYIVSNQEASMLDFAKIIDQQQPGVFPLPKGNIPKFMLYLAGPSQGFSWKFIRNNVGLTFHYDNHRSTEELGIEYRPFEETLKDHVAALTNS